MTRRDVLEHPDLNKAWAALESSAPTVEWEELAVSPEYRPARRRRPRLRRVLAIAAIAVLMVFLGSETVGVFAARRAIASNPAVSDEPVVLSISARDVAHPTQLLEFDPTQVAMDMTATSSMVVAYLTDISDPSADSGWQPDVIAQLTPEGWQPLDVGLDLVIDSVVVASDEIILGFSESGDDIPDRDYSVHQIPSGSDQGQPLHSFSDADEETSFGTITGNEDGLVAASRTGNALQVWLSTDGQAWIPGESFASGAVNDSTTRDDNNFLVGYKSGLVPFEEFGVHTIWTQTGNETPEPVEISGLRSQGFGYILGGFRLSDGLEDIVAHENGLLAYTGYLQVWTGFSDGITLEPSESWSSLVVTSSDGSAWEAHLLSDFAINQVIPFGDGLLATAARAPESDTRIVEDEDGTTHEVAVSPDSSLYYSEDGLTWHPVADSPVFTQPLLLQTSEGQAVVVDEDAIEDQINGTSIIHVVTVP